jgi:hypothetical protein
MRRARLEPQSPLTPDERELRVLTDQAWELRDSPYFLDACAAIVEWFERRHLRRFERGEELRAAARRARNAHLIALLRETNPATLEETV